MVRFGADFVSLFRTHSRAFGRQTEKKKKTTSNVLADFQNVFSGLIFSTLDRAAILNLAACRERLLSSEGAFPFRFKQISCSCPPLRPRLGRPSPGENCRPAKRNCVRYQETASNALVAPLAISRSYCLTTTKLRKKQTDYNLMIFNLNNMVIV